MNNTINLKKLHENALLPAYQTAGAIAFDLHAVEECIWTECGNSVFTTIVKTGLAIELPENTAMMIYPRSGWGFNHNIGLANGTGLIDSDYRGEIMVKLIAIAPNKLPTIEVGTRIAQATISKVEKPILCFVDELSDTDRGTGGFGHTGH